MAGAAFFTGIGIPSDNIYSAHALALLSCALLCCLGALLVRGTPAGKWGQGILLGTIATGIAVQCAILVMDRELPLPSMLEWPFNVRLVAAGIVGILGLQPARWIRYLRMAVLAGIFVILGYTVVRVYNHPLIDVYMFQTKSAHVLLQGKNPFDPQQVRFPNVYPREGAEVLYGPGTVDYTPAADSPRGRLRHGFPYLPLSLLLAVPGAIAGDIRYSSIAAIAISSLLMAFARPGRHAPLAACLFLFTPRVFYVTGGSWTEPLLVFTFSLAMFCACRMRRALPWALGLFLATKQYTILLLPLVFLLGEESDRPWRAGLKLLFQSLAVAALVTLPFALWNFREFVGSVVEWQLAQPFRMDSCSYLAMIARSTHGWRPPFWIPFAVAAPVVAWLVRRNERTPAGFAAGVTLVCLVFFLFSKQAFTNYYYFVIGAACWAVAATEVGEEKRIPDAGKTDIVTGA